MTNKEAMMKKVMLCSFMLVDAQLFLDTHPTDKQALSFYKKHKEKYENAKAEYEKAYGPITVDSADSDTVWEWSTTPWPWERMD